VAAGRAPLPGQALPYEILPMAEMPHTVNPRNGFFVSANNDPAGTTLDNDPLDQLRPDGGIYYLNPGYDGLRAGRITEALKAALRHGKLDAGDVQRIQDDTVLLDAEFFAPRIGAALLRARTSGEPQLRALAHDPKVVEGGRAAGRLGPLDADRDPAGLRRGGRERAAVRAVRAGEGRQRRGHPLRGVAQPVPGVDDRRRGRGNWTRRWWTASGR
jgi:penicillin amidase